MISLKGVDVSYAQGKIDWAKVKGNVDFAILRCGFGSDITSQDDAQFIANVEGCEANNIPWGAYLYSYATNLDEAESEVQHILRLLEDRVPLYPIYIDMEDADGYKHKHNVSDEMCAEICVHYCKRMTAYGYLAGVYANKDWRENRINNKRLETFPFWLAQWAKEPTYKGEFGIWQNTSDGKLPGINGRVDMNICYVDYPTIIKEKELNGYKNFVDEKAQSKPTSKIKVSDKVQFKGGNVYSSSTAKTAASKRKAAPCKITIVADGAPHPYHCIGGGVYGWVDKDTIAVDKPVNKPRVVEFKVGDKVKLVQSAKYYANSKTTIPQFVKDWDLYIRQLSNKDALISPNKTGAITGWVNTSDLNKI